MLFAVAFILAGGRVNAGRARLTGDTLISAHTETRIALLAPPARLTRDGLVQALWHSRSLRVQLLIIFVVIDFVAALVAGSVTILKARTATRVEIAASMELAELLVGEAVNLMQQEVPAERFLSDLSSQLRLVRHVRIGVKDAAGNPLAVRPPGGSPDALRSDERTPAPAWFAGLVAAPVESRNVPVIVNGAPIGAVEIVSEPRDEIAEVWENTVALAAVALGSDEPPPLTARLHHLEAGFAAFAASSAHPRELPEHPDFQNAVNLLADPAVPLDVVMQYALGANWPLSCVALAALPRRGDNASAIESLVAFESTRLRGPFEGRYG